MMRRWMWFCVGLLLGVVPMLAFADTTSGYFDKYRSSANSQLFATADAVDAYCKQSGSTRKFTPLAGLGAFTGTPLLYGAGPTQQSRVAGYCTNADGSLNYTSIGERWMCPDGAMPSNGNLCVWPTECPSGSVRDPLTGQCSAPPCEAGQEVTVRAWVGYASSINNVNDWIQPRVPATASDGQCQVGSLNIVPGTCTVSPDMGGPPYPGSCEFKGTTTGQESTPADGEFDDPLPPISCPTGTAPGEVNGIGGCYRASTSTSSTSSSTGTDGTTTITKTEVNPDGSTTITKETKHADGSITTSRTVIGGWATGGTGSLPGQGGDSGGGTGGGSGSGGGSGGGAAAAGQTGDTEQAKFCNDNPNSVMCKDKLKIDEEGTPTAEEAGKLGGVAEQAKTGLEEHLTYMNSDSWKKEDLGFGWSAPIPAGSCAALRLHNQNIDICTPLERVRQIWAYIFSFMAALYIYRRGTFDVTK